MSLFQRSPAKPPCDHEWVLAEKFFVPMPYRGTQIYANVICPRCHEVKSMRASEWDAIVKWKSGQTQGVKMP